MQKTSFEVRGLDSVVQVTVRGKEDKRAKIRSRMKCTFLININTLAACKTRGFRGKSIGVLLMFFYARVERWSVKIAHKFRLLWKSLSIVIEFILLVHSWRTKDYAKRTSPESTRCA